MTAVFYGDEIFRGSGVVGLDGLRTLLNEVFATMVRGEGDRASGTQRIRTRQGNDASTRHAPPGPKPVGNLNGRPPAQSQGGLADTPTTVLPTLPEAEPDTGGGPSQFPDRPDRTDPAHEVWTLVERAQGGDTEAFGLIYDRYVDTVFRFIYFRGGNRPRA